MDLGSELSKKRQQQRLSALELANAKRSAVARLKRELKAKRLDPVETLINTPEEWKFAVESITIDDYLMAIPGFGRTTVTDIVIEFAASAVLRIGNVTPRRRKELADLISLMKS